MVASGSIVWTLFDMGSQIIRNPLCTALTMLRSVFRVECFLVFGSGFITT